MWVLVLLAAVFSMHGVQCPAADSHAGHGVVAPVHASVDYLERAGLAASPALVADQDWSGALAGMTGLVSRPGMPRDGAPVHGATFWSACLAVLLAGLALLGIGVFIRRVLAPFVRSRAPSVLWHTGWSRLPRPPDLSALCLLRI